jgi:hypothetical protein
VELSAMPPIALQIGIIANFIAVCSDLRDHRAYMADHPGASAITTAQVCHPVPSFFQQSGAQTKS